MTEIINLNKARKHKLKQQEKRQAVENRIRHGIASKQRAAHRREAETLGAKVEGHRLLRQESEQKKVDEL